MRTRLLVVFAGLLAAVGCTPARRNCVPESIAANRNLIDLCAEADAQPSAVSTGAQVGAHS